ncbi:SMI1/KNR4 family protein [Acidovorax sp. Leaf78]|uniref:SMI1/KNR4 family protein n=1 Tax=Acidovorax sp. Leaf78 TaxID=1736237 RepID=UPI000A9F509C|nr:SMI1/KNR4 family protein [Acidovorax sp. Leaf78]
MTVPTTPPHPAAAVAADAAFANADALDDLATQVGIEVPALLRALVAAGATFYGPDWPGQWRTLCLTQPPAFISCEDFEWMDAQERADAAQEWLHAAAQGGRRFLPFAQNGAGDAYCLTLGVNALPHTVAPVALVPHDDDEAMVLHASFDDFAAAMLLQSMADLSHQMDEFSLEEAVTQTRLDVACTSALMLADSAERLQAMAGQAPQQQSVQDGPRARPRDVWALISPQQLAQELERLPDAQAAPLRFSVVPRWELRSAPAQEVNAPTAVQSPAALTWQSLAADPATRRQAIRAYQAEFGGDLPTAKAAVDALNPLSR